MGENDADGGKRTRVLYNDVQGLCTCDHALPKGDIASLIIITIYRYLSRDKRFVLVLKRKAP